MNEQAPNTSNCASCGHPPHSGHGSQCAKGEPGVIELEAAIETKKQLTTWTDKIVEDALDDLQIEFDFNLHEQNFTFHGREHSQDVIDRSTIILRTLQSEGTHINEKDIALAKIAAAYHDSKQDWEVNDQWEKDSDDEKFGKKLRKRKTRDNEVASAQKAIEAMHYANEGAGETIFSKTDMKRVMHAIEGTIPGFDPDLGTVIQPSAEASGDIIVKAIALADLGEAGMTGPAAFLEGGDNLFVEENIDMWDLDLSTLSDEQKTYYKNRMDGWNTFQPIFANGRKEKLESELKTLPKAARTHLKKLFNRFDESISAAQERADKRTEMSFDDLYKDMGFSKYNEQSQQAA
jgi:hypothetical protein